MSDAIILPRRVVPQPTPALHAGGDCGACVLAGLLSVDVPEAYRRARNGGEHDAFSWSSMAQATFRLRAYGWLDRLITDVPRWHVPDAVRTFGDLSTQQSLGWFAWVRMAIDGGYYGIASVDSEQRGVAHGLINHWIMIVGARCRETEVTSAGGERLGARIAHDLLISNSSTRHRVEEWVETHDFLTRWGGFNVLLARPA